MTAPALVGDMLGEDSLPHVRHARHDLCHGHEYDLLACRSTIGANDGPPRWVAQRWGPSGSDRI
ncbi:MAG: hypothetical protein ACRDTC_03560 [Pseudonocardiaceae bacterium]